MFTVQKKRRVLVVSKWMGETGGWKDEVFTDDQVAMYIRPMQSVIIAGTDNAEDRSKWMEQSKLIATHARMILDWASRKVVSVQWEQNKTILSILQWAFWPHIAGWTVQWDDMKEIKKFANMMLQEIQFPKEKVKKPDMVANDENVKLAA